MKRFIQAVAILLILAMSATTVPASLPTALTPALARAEAADAPIAGEYEIGVGEGRVLFLADGAWEITEPLPEGATLQDGALVLEGLDIDDSIFANGPLTICLRGENRAFNINADSDLTILGPGAFELSKGISAQGALTVDGCAITVSAEDVESAACGLWVGRDLSVRNARVFLGGIGMTEPGIYVSSGYAMIEDSEIVVDSPSGDAFGFMVPADDIEVPSDENVVVIRNSTLDIRCGSVCIYERGNMLVENSELSLVTTCAIHDFTGFNSYDEKRQYLFSIRDSTLYAAHEADGVTGIALGFYNAIVNAENSRIVSKGYIDAWALTAVDTDFEVEIDVPRGEQQAMIVSDEASFDRCALRVTAPGGDGYWNNYGTRFTDCEIDIESKGNGLLVERGPLELTRTSAKLRAGESGVRVQRYSDLALLGSNVAISGKNGIYGNSDTTLTVMGGNVEIDSTEAALVIESYNEHPEEAVVLGPSMVVDGDSRLEGTRQGSTYMYTFGNDSCLEWGEWSEDWQYQRFIVEAQNAAKALSLHGNGEFEGQVVAARGRMTTGMLASFTASYTSGVDITELTFELPETLKLAEDSVTVNGARAEAACEDGKFTVQTAESSGTVRFGAYAVGEGAGEVRGAAKFRDGDADAEAELGSCAITVERFSLGLPTATRRQTLTVNGNAIPGSAVTFYDNGRAAGSASANLAGRFTGELTLSGTGADHAITARVVAPDGETIDVEAQSLKYDVGIAEAQTVTMRNIIHGEKDGELKEEVTVIRYGDGDESVPRYAFWPAYPEIDYEVRFTNCNDPLGMGLVYLTTTDHSGRKGQVNLTYDAARDVWTGTGSYDEFTLPERVSVAYTGDNYGTLSVPGEDGGEDIAIKYRPLADGSVQYGEGDDALTVKVEDDAYRVEDANGNTYAVEYDGEGVLRETVNGKPILSVTPDGNALRYETADGSTLTLEADDDSLSIATGQGAVRVREDGSYTLADAGGNETAYEVEGGRLAAITYADGSAERFAYDEGGNLASETARDGAVTSYEYDAEGTLVRTLRGGVQTYALEDGGNEQRLTDASGAVTRLAYDDGDRLVEMTWPDGQTVSFAYDEDGNLAQLKDPRGNVVDYAYDADGNMLSVANNGETVSSYTYDDDGGLTEKTTADGTTTRYAYNDDGMLTALRNEGGAPSEYGLEYGDDGRVAALSQPDGTWRFACDDQGQLLEAVAPDGTATAYTYTASGTRASVRVGDESVDYESNALNQITRAGDVRYEYDANGCLVRRIAPEGETEYGWEDGRLARLLEPDGTEYLYEYDVFGNRSAVTVNGETTRYLWIPAELPVVIGEIRPDGSYVQYLQGVGLEAMVDGDKTYYYQYNPQGSTVSITDAAGAVVNRYGYGHDGTLTAEEETVGNPFRYAGRYGIMTGGDGLWHMRARDVLQETGSFTSPDPARQENDLNLYRYAGNNPVENGDLTGCGKIHLIILITIKISGKTYVRVVRKVYKIVETTETTLVIHKKDGRILSESIRKFTEKYKLDHDEFVKWASKQAEEEQARIAAGQGKISDDLAAEYQKAYKRLLDEMKKLEDYLRRAKEAGFNVPSDIFKTNLGLFSATAAASASDNVQSSANALPSFKGAMEAVGAGLMDFIAIYEEGRRLMIEDSGMPDWYWDLIDIADIVDPYWITDLTYILRGLLALNEETYIYEYKQVTKYIYVDDPDPEYETEDEEVEEEIDPSGYVYEAVPGNRLADVTATLYYKAELDTPDDEAVVWDAAAYDQVNPQRTDWNGEYGWMVGVGWYKVVYEKDGYAAAESDWLPVPPVQTEVNVGMVSTAPPALREAACYDEGRVDLSFEGYVDADSVEGGLELRRADGSPVDGEFTCLDAVGEGDAGIIGSRFRFWAWDELPRDGELTLRLSGVTGVNGLVMEDAELRLSALATVGDVAADAPDSVGVDADAEVWFTVTDAWGSPLAGQAIALDSPSACVSVGETALVTDDEGRACATVRGVCPGTGILAASVPGHDDVILRLEVEATAQLPDGYVEAAARARVWMTSLRDTWTDGKPEDEAMAAEYVDAFVKDSDEARRALAERGDASAAGLASLDAWDARINEIVYGRINQLIPQEEYNEIAAMLNDRSRLYLLATP